MNDSYNKLIQGNKLFSDNKTLNEPDYFKNLSLGQTPEYLWIGCSDSRVPANEITSTQSGEVFVHRNIANLVVHTDLNLLSVVEYAVRFLNVKHVIVCGHYGCGGIKAAMSDKTYGFVDSWLTNIKDVFHQNEKQLMEIEDEEKRSDCLTELNVIQQVRNLAKTSIIPQVWKKRPLHLHGWV